MKTRKQIKDEVKKEILKEFGRIGGIASMKSRTKKERSELGKKAAKARWGKRK